MKRLAVALLLSATLAGCTTSAPGQGGIDLSGPSGTAAPAPTGSTAPCTYTTIAADRSTVKDVGKPPARVRAGGKAVMTVTTNLGVIEVAMDAAGAPCAVASFNYLAGKHFFDDTPCHRLTAAQNLAVLQRADPSGTGTGGPAYQYAEENLASLGTTSLVTYPRGLVGVARAQDAGTSGSQFFFMIKTGELPPDYTPLGTVTRGLDVLDQVAAGGIVPSDLGAEDGAPKTQVTLQRVTVVYS